MTPAKAGKLKNGVKKGGAKTTTGKVATKKPKAQGKGKVSTKSKPKGPNATKSQSTKNTKQVPKAMKVSTKASITVSKKKTKPVGKGKGGSKKGKK